MGGQVVSRLLIIGSGLVYPAYNSYKAVKAADVRQYVRWIMYWVVFAVFSTLESFGDIFISWLPFYYELKVGFVLWLALPYTKGSTYLYRKFVHPNLSKREHDIDRFLHQAKAQGYHTVMDVGSRGLNLAATAVVTAAVKGQAVVSDRLKSYSTMDISQMNDRAPIHRSQSALGNFEPVRRVTETHRRRAGSSPPPSPTPLDKGATGEMQFRPFSSMMNLSSHANHHHNPSSNASAPENAVQQPTPIQEEGADFREIDYDEEGHEVFDSRPTTYTHDDMRIRRRANYAQEAVVLPDELGKQYTTLPKNFDIRKERMKQMPPPPDRSLQPGDSGKKASVRRSNRRTKKSQYVYYDDATVSDDYQ